MIYLKSLYLYLNVIRIL